MAIIPDARGAESRCRFVGHGESTLFSRAITRAHQDHSMPEQRSAARRRNIERMLSPRHVAFIGGAWAAAALRNCTDFGFEGEMWYVNPRRPEVDGHPVFGSVRDLPRAPDCAYVAVSAERSIEILTELANRGAGGAVCYAAGFAEKGAEGVELQKRLVAAAGDMAVLGPNCYGMLDYRIGLHVWAGDRMERHTGPGIAIVSQSGALAEVLVFEQRDVPIVSVVSVGNQAVLGIEDIVDVLLDDSAINAIGIYLEGVRDARLLSEVAARALDRGVPIVALKSGRSETAARLALGHTSSLAGEDTLYQAFFDRLGIIRVDSLSRMLETLKVLSYSGPLATPRFAAMTISGGGAAMIADYAEGCGAVPVPLDEGQVQQLRSTFPDYVNCGNPLDITVGGMEPQMVALAADVLAAGDVEFVMTMLDSLPDGSYEEVNEMIMNALASALERHGKRGGVLGCLPESLPPRTRQKALRLGLVPMQGLEEAVVAIADAARYGHARRNGAETPRTARVLEAPPKPPERRRTFDEVESKAFLGRAGIAVPEAFVVSAGETADAARSLGFPVVLKCVDAAIAHKSEAGAVAIGLEDETALAAALDAMLVRLPREGRRFLVERQVGGVVAEVIVGVRYDPTFGHALLVGAGGVLVELIEDRQTLLLPTTRAAIETAVDSLRISKLLDAFRGGRTGDRTALVDALEAIARLAWSERERLHEIDVNPLLVLGEGDGVVAVDALVTLAEE